MKVSEIKNQIQDYSPEQLHKLIVELYKALPKTLREDHGIDELLKNPDSEAAGKNRKENKQRPLSEIEKETLQFVEYARAQYYLAPNRYVSKNERPKWRFTARRLYKELSTTAKYPQTAPRAAELLEQLYRLLCEACGIDLFSAYDPFESVGIAQVEFFTRVLELHETVLSKQDFVTKALSLLVETELNRYTLYSDLMRQILAFLRTPDLKFLALDQADRRLRSVRQTKSPSSKEVSDYEQDRRANNLCEFVFRSYCALRELDRALEYLETHYYAKDPEVKLYILVRLLFEYGETERIVRVIVEAKKKGVEPRGQIHKLKQFIEQHHRLPKYMNVLE
ncbi:MAG: hypothetical protein AAB209_11955 [Bacteroidota bacterium]